MQTIAFSEKERPMKRHKEKIPIDKLTIRYYNGTADSYVTDSIIRELSVGLYVNGHKTITIACAGIHLDELAVGFLRSEGIIGSSGDIDRVDVSYDMTTVHVSLNKHITVSDERSIFSSGARESIGHIPTEVVATSIQIPAPNVIDLMEKHLVSTTLHSITHGTHCSSLINADGTFIISREDIGRHNTFDMIGGFSLLSEIECSDTMIATTGRVSTEIIYKVWKLGIPIILSHAVPTSRAITTANDAGITIIGYMRKGTMRVYSHEERVIF